MVDGTEINTCSCEARPASHHERKICHCPHNEVGKTEMRMHKMQVVISHWTIISVMNEFQECKKEWRYK